jgi:hypothetical protein
MVCNPGERGDVASGNPDGKAVSGGFLSLLMGPISCAKLKEIGNKHFTHLPSCSNLQVSNGYDSTHTHAWVLFLTIEMAHVAKIAIFMKKGAL